MDNNWGVQDSDWQLRRLQQDCVRTSDRALSALYSTLQQEVRQVHAEYLRNFGPNSAQFAEYISLLVQKLQTAGIASAACLDWLNSAASGVLPAEHVPANYNSQSQTLTYIPGEFRVQMELTGEASSMPDDAEFDSQAVADLIAHSPEVAPVQAPPVQAASFQNIPSQNVALPQSNPAIAAPQTSFDNPWGDSPDPPQVQKRSGLNSLMPSTWENGQNISGANQIQKISGDWQAPSQAASISGSNQVISGEHNFPGPAPIAAPVAAPVAAPITAPIAAPVATPISPAPIPNNIPSNPSISGQFQMPQQPGFSSTNGSWGHARQAADAWGIPSQQEPEAPPAPAPTAPGPFNSPFNPQSTLPLDGAWGVPQEQALQANPEPQPQPYQQQPFQQPPVQQQPYQQQAYQQQPFQQPQYQQQPFQPHEEERQDEKDYSYDPATAWD